MLPVSGIEVEYAAVIEGASGVPPDPRVVARLVVASHPAVLARRGIRSYGMSSDAMLSNGARLYDDEGHPEYATPECDDLITLVACERVGDELMQSCCAVATKGLPPGQRIVLLKNNTDYRGHTWGCHENYLVSPHLFESLIRRHERALYCVLVPFLVSRQLICGAGRVGGQGGWSGYQISQRADFIQTVVGLETTSRRPIVNTRDEALADRERFRRLHLVLGDSNISPYAIFLKIGTTRLVLRMLEDGAAALDLALADPVAALQSISHDWYRPIFLADGSPITAIDLQSKFLDAAASYLNQAGGNAEEQMVLAEWAQTLDTMRSDPLALSDCLDWVIKQSFLEHVRSEEGIDWNAPLLRELDIRYHDLDPQRGLFYTLEANNLIRPLADVQRLIGERLVHPPPYTRACTRATALAMWSDDLIQVDWDHMLSSVGRQEWPDPSRP